MSGLLVSTCPRCGRENESSGSVVGCESCGKEYEVLKPAPLAKPASTPHLEFPACAAIRLHGGEIVAGHRHHNCLATLKRLGIGGLGRVASVQGFMTTRGRFVERAEAQRLFIAAGMVSADPGGLRGTDLYSEDLY